jgi:septation ring formation regulator EzrA
MRENLLIQKLWNVFLRKKMENEMRNSQQIDEAFKAIKTETGVTDVQEMVKKFLTREQTYSQLLFNVNDSERKIEKVQADNDMLRGKLHDLKIDSEAIKSIKNVICDGDHQRASTSVGFNSNGDS